MQVYFLTVLKPRSSKSRCRKGHAFPKGPRGELLLAAFLASGGCCLAFLEVEGDVSLWSLSPSSYGIISVCLCTEISLFFFKLRINFSLSWDFIAAWRLSTVVTSEGYSLVAVHGLLVKVASFVVAHGLSRCGIGLNLLAACGIFLHQGSSPCPLKWRADPQPLDHQWKWSESRSVVSDSLGPHRLYNPWNSPGHNTGVGSLSLLKGIFQTQGSNPGLPHCRQVLYQLSHNGSPQFPFSCKAICYIGFRAHLNPV